MRVLRFLRSPCRTRVEAIVAALNAQEGEPDASAHPSGKGSGPVTVEEVMTAVEELSRLH